MTKPTLAWRAGPDQIGHAYVQSRRRVTTALCGARLVAERSAWPSVVRCPDCLMVAERERVA